MPEIFPSLRGLPVIRFLSHIVIRDIVYTVSLRVDSNRISEFET